MYCFSRFCFACLSNEEELFSLNSIDSDNVRLIEKVIFCMNDMVDKRLPNFICKKCYHTVQELYSFKKMVVSSKSLLMKYISKLENSLNLTNRYDIRIHLLNLNSCQNARQRETHLLNKARQNDTRERCISVKSDPLSDGDDPGYSSVASSPCDDTAYYEFIPVASENKAAETAPGKSCDNICPDSLFPKVEKIDIDDDDNFLRLYGKNCLRIDLLKNADSLFELSNCTDFVRDAGNNKSRNSQAAAMNCEKGPEGSSGNHQKRNEKNKNMKNVSFPCPLCDETFKVNEALQGHMKLHERPYFCSKCRKKFAYISHLQRHKTSHAVTCKRGPQPAFFAQKATSSRSGSVPKKTYTCNKCNEKFQKSTELKTHLHVHIYTYTCSSCPRRFKQPHHLQQHVRVHSPNVLYACSDCPLKFTKLPDLKRHKLTHSISTFFGRETYPFRTRNPSNCVECNVSFNSVSSLREHLLTHSRNKYKCGECDSKFGRMVDLENHKAIHKNEKRYTCPICSVRFSRMCNLNIHVLSHSSLFESFK